MTPSPLPLIGIPCCVREIRDHPSHIVNEKYVLAASDATGGLPMLIPALGERIDAAELAARLDGLILTGSPSNVEPHHYRGTPSRAGTLHDSQRDRTTLPLVRAAVAQGVPLVAICRGIQELNVALGGSLHQRVHEVAGRIDHRSRQGTTAERYAHDAHRVSLAPGGLLERLAGAPELLVNSLHAQGIDRLAPPLVVEAEAPDGQIEAVRHRAAAFVVGVQWHPEYRVLDSAFGRALFAAFGEACRGFARRRRGG